MKNVTYALFEEPITENGNSRIAYGVIVFSKENETEPATVLTAIHDVTAERQPLSDLVSQCNQFDLSPAHLLEVLEDFLIT